MSAEETYADGAQETERRASRRFAIKIAAVILLLFALTVGTLYVLFAGKLRRERSSQTNAATSNQETLSLLAKEKDFYDAR